MLEIYTCLIVWVVNALNIEHHILAVQVNGTDLAEIDGGEVSITNLHSCNGPEFVFQLCFSIKQDVASTRSSGENTLFLFVKYMKLNFWYYREHLFSYSLACMFFSIPLFLFWVVASDAMWAVSICQLWAFLELVSKNVIFQVQGRLKKPMHV